MGTERVCSSLHALTRCRLSAVLFCSWLLSAQPYEFPEGCEWAERSVTCVGSGDVKVPLEVSTKTHNFTLRGYTVALLPERAISPNGTDAELQTLSLTHNNIQTIETCAFCGLQVLRVLDLSHNFLKIVSPSAFLDLGKLRTLSVNDALIGTGAAQLGRALSMHPLRNLHRLELAGNALLAMPLHGFGNLDLSTLVLSNNSLEALDKTNVSNLKAFKKIRVYLSMNPFRCDCDHWEFYSWLKNSSQCADASGVVCAYPEDKRGSLVENMTCKTSDLEAVSYVFLGIVLALIGVVFLMVLYLNRRGIKRWLNNIREACRDQMEVYHYRYEQDSDPRLANVDV